MQKFPIQSPRSKQNNHRGLDCLEIVCMYCSSSSKCRKGFVSLCLQLFCICTTATEDSCYQNEVQGRKSLRALWVGLTPHLLINTPNSLPTQIHPASAQKLLQTSTDVPWLHLSQSIPESQPRWDAESRLQVEWSQFSSATRLRAFLTSLKGAQVISCPRLNLFHLLQLY